MNQQPWLVDVPEFPFYPDSHAHEHFGEVEHRFSQGPLLKPVVSVTTCKEHGAFPLNVRSCFGRKVTKQFAERDLTPAERLRTFPRLARLIAVRKRACGAELCRLRDPSTARGRVFGCRRGGWIRLQSAALWLGRRGSLRRIGRHDIRWLNVCFCASSVFARFSALVYRLEKSSQCKTETFVGLLW